MSGRQYEGTPLAADAPDCAWRDGAHTPGPWQCMPYNRDDSLYAVYDANGNELTYDDDEHEANARLIAAAPELLEALREATSALKGNGYGVEDLEAAIARATGAA